MAKINKNTDHTELKKFFLGKGTIEFLPLYGTDNFIELPVHWHKYSKTDKIRYTCNPITTCPICEYLNQIKPKTRGQKIKERISKLWKLCNPFKRTI